LNSAGRPVGALCTDFSAQLLADTREKVTTTLGIAFLAIYPAMILLVIFSARSASTLLGKFEKNKPPLPLWRSFAHFKKAPHI
jgi:hypothetical protein